MTERERLIELLLEHTDNAFDISEDKHFVPSTTIGKIADTLLANGVIVPPCKVGDVVWFVCFGEIYPHTIRRIETTKFGNFACSSSMSFNLENFGKTVFLTKEEAEAKLKEGVKE